MASQKNVSSGYFIHAVAGTLNQLSAITILENLHLENERQYSLLEVAVMNDHLDQIPRIALTQENMTRRGTRDGTTPLYKALYSGTKNGALVAHLLTLENVTAAQRRGRTILHEHTKFIPKELLTAETISIEDDEKNTPIHTQIGSWPINLLTQERISKKNTNGDTPLHAAAKNGELHKIPTKLLTKANMLMPNSTGQTPLHFACMADDNIQTPPTSLPKSNEPYYIPFHLFGPEDMLAIDMRGNTILHCLAITNNIWRAPTRLLSKENLTQLNAKHVTPLHTIAEFFDIESIPMELLTEQALTIQDRNTTTVLDRLSAYGKLDQLLGIKLSESCRALVGDEWFDKNADYIKQIDQTREALENPEIETSIDLF